jgi:hypothetical protein
MLKIHEDGRITFDGCSEASCPVHGPSIREVRRAIGEAFEAGRDEYRAVWA